MEVAVFPVIIPACNASFFVVPRPNRFRASLLTYSFCEAISLSSTYPGSKYRKYSRFTWKVVKGFFDLNPGLSMGLSQSSEG